MIGNTKCNKWCCFCKWWYDPTNSAIKPRGVISYLFEVDPKVVSRCSIKNNKTRSIGTCPKFESKMNS